MRWRAALGQARLRRHGLNLRDEHGGCLVVGLRSHLGGLSNADHVAVEQVTDDRVPVVYGTQPLVVPRARLRAIVARSSIHRVGPTPLPGCCDGRKLGRLLAEHPAQGSHHLIDVPTKPVWFRALAERLEGIEGLAVRGFEMPPCASVDAHGDGITYDVGLFVHSEREAQDFTPRPRRTCGEAALGQHFGNDDPARRFEPLDLARRDDGLGLRQHEGLRLCQDYRYRRRWGQRDRRRWWWLARPLGGTPLRGLWWDFLRRLPLGRLLGGAHGGSTRDPGNNQPSRRGAR